MENSLAGHVSPYLRQHADQPVPWSAWTPDALRMAVELDRPLLVSIGYAACHWCHVMAHESFDDEATAADLARSFVPIKVDREERPDLDDLYMSAAVAMTGQGGWPLNVFCTPDGRPFFAGTYFPPDDRHGMPSFRRVLAAIAEAWELRRDEVEAQADELTAAIEHEARLVDRLGGAAAAAAGSGAGAVVRQAVSEIPPGFGPAPKFPRPSLIELCFREGGSAAMAMSMATEILDAMAAGGIYDHLAGGFCRYSTDAEWLVPHFEKMLTDQALLAPCYLHGGQLTGRDDYRRLAGETLDFVLDELRLPGEGLASSLDADAGGVEGGHMLFTVDEMREALGEDGPLIEAALGWYRLGGEGVLHRPAGASPARPAEVEEARRVLLEYRHRCRPAPALDAKVVTEWNAMAVCALAEVGFALECARYVDAGVEIGEELWSGARSADGGFVRVRGAATPGFAQDYAWMVTACLALARATGTYSWIERAGEVAEDMLGRFGDVRGSLWTTEAPVLVVRTKAWMDGAVPSANSVAARALVWLGIVLDDRRFLDAGVRIVEEAMPILRQRPTAMADMVAAFALADRRVEVVVGTEELLSEVRTRYLPDAVLVWGERFDSALWRDRRDDAAYVCRDFVCAAPAFDRIGFGAALDAVGVP